VALLTVGALAITAATVDVPRQGDPGYGTGSGSAIGDDTGSPDRETSADGPTLRIPPVFALLATVVTGVAVVVLTIYILLSLELSDVVTVAVAGVVVMLVSMLIFALIQPGLPAAPDPQEVGNETDNASGGGSGDLGEVDTDDTRQPNYDVPLALVGLAGLCVLVLALTIVRFSGSEGTLEEVPVERESEAGSEAVVTAVGEAAGRAADDLQADASVGNTVYRAWEEMTAALDVPRRSTTTPTEFADAAVEAGLAREDVRELTAIFEAVRYGDRPVTDERERRAETALRRIESTYAGDDDE